MEKYNKWEESVHKVFAPNAQTVNHIQQDSKFKIQIEFKIDDIPPITTIQTYFKELSKEDIQLFIEEAKSNKQTSVIILATCECFDVCDSQGNCHKECYICYPPPAARCCCPGMCP